MAMRTSGAGVREVTVALGHPDELFEPAACDVANGAPPGVPGIEQVRRELSSGPLRAPIKLVVEMPTGQATPQVERGVKQAIAGYCRSGIAQAENELAAIRRDGTQTLIFGVIVLAAFLAASEAVLSSGAPKDIRDFFGNGLFLVAAWVGMWYPLDTLIYSGRPYRFERRLLRAMSAMEIVVRPAGAG
jgi:hypothetical protein